MDSKTEQREFTRAVDRREFTRVRAHVEAQVSADSPVLIAGEARDISLNGVYVLCDERLPPGTPCRVFLYLGEPQEQLVIRANGKIARADETGIGVELTGIPVDSFDHLRNLVLYNSGKELERVEGEFKSHTGIKKRP
jgi:hypothetical protein